MIDSRSAQPTVALLGGLKTVVFLLCAVWGLSHFLSFYKGGPRISALGEYAPLHFPDPAKMELVDVKGRRRELKSLWRFNLRNEGDVDAKGVSFELPFGGFYRIKAGDQPAGRVADFDKTISIESLDPTLPLSIQVWSDMEADAQYEKDTRVNVSGSSIQVEYPVKVRGIMAWIERSKLLISILVFIAVVATLL